MIAPQMKPRGVELPNLTFKCSRHDQGTLKSSIMSYFESAFTPAESSVSAHE